MYSKKELYIICKTCYKLLTDKFRSYKSIEKLAETMEKRGYEGYHINIENPVGFDDKIWWIKKYAHSDLMVQCADKIGVREYVENLGLGKYLVPIYGVWESAKSIDFEKLPDCYIKCNHTSGANYLYKKGETSESFLRNLFSLYLKRDYSRVNYEWVYIDIPRRVFAEKILEGAEPFKDYRLFCFDGKCKLVMVNTGMVTNEGEHAHHGVSRTFYNSQYEPISDITIKGDVPCTTFFEKPSNWDEMVDVAEKLSTPFPFVRIDLYNIDGTIYLSEMTFLPNGGTNFFQPREWDERLGSWIDVSKYEKN